MGENTEREISLYKAVVSLMCCCSRDGEKQSERISISDRMRGQMWVRNHMLLLFFPLYIMFVLFVNHLQMQNLKLQVLSHFLSPSYLVISGLLIENIVNPRKSGVCKYVFIEFQQIKRSDFELMTAGINSKG